MSTEHKIRILAGSFIIVSLALGLMVSPYFFIMTGFVGVNLIQSAFTRFCPAEMVFNKLGPRNKSGCAL